MASQAQISANQSNAALSTGPRTTEGKSIASQNALKWGLTAKRIILPGENAEEYQARFDAIVEQVQPATGCEFMHAEDIAGCDWRINRIERVKSAYIANQLNKVPAEHRDLALGQIMLSDTVRRFDRYLASERRASESTWRRLHAFQKERKDRERKEAEAREAAEKAARQAQLRNEANPAQVGPAVSPARVLTATPNSPPAPKTPSAM